MLIRNISNAIKEHECVRNMELKFLGEEMVSPTNITLAWCERNKFTTLIAKNKEKIVGHCSMFPTTKHFYNAFITGIENDVELESSDILTEGEPIEQLYLCVICIEKDYRKELLSSFLKEYITIYDEYTNDSTIIFVEHCTKGGEKFVNDFKFNPTDIDNRKTKSWKDFKSLVLSS